MDGNESVSSFEERHVRWVEKQDILEPDNEEDSELSDDEDVTSLGQLRHQVQMLSIKIVEKDMEIKNLKAESKAKQDFLVVSAFYVLACLNMQWEVILLLPFFNFLTCRTIWGISLKQTSVGHPSHKNIQTHKLFCFAKPNTFDRFS